MPKRRLLVALATLSLGWSGLALITAGPAAGATPVGDEATLRSAFANDSAIDLTQDISLTQCGTDATTGDVDRTNTNPLVLDGHGFTITQTCASGSQNGVLDAVSNGALTIKNVTIKGGNSTDTCGGIHYQGSGGLTVTDSTVTGNHSGSSAGGVCGDGAALSIGGSTISGNDGNNVVESDSDVTVTNSTVSGNTHSGTISSRTAVTVINSTLADNQQAVISSLGQVTLVYATVVDNGGAEGPQIATGAPLTSFGSVIALGKPLTSFNCNIPPGTVSHGFNFSDDKSCGFTQASDRQAAGDPMLGALANNGGATQTRKPNAGSPLLDFIPIASCQSDGASGITTDQVGTTRPQGAGCEIGAFEVPVAAPPVAPPAQAVNAAARLTG
jgi:Periplasmic copper-binding protein (NosD)